jgi:hypothetical protein
MGKDSHGLRKPTRPPRTQVSGFKRFRMVEVDPHPLRHPIPNRPQMREVHAERLSGPLDVSDQVSPHHEPPAGRLTDLMRHHAEVRPGAKPVLPESLDRSSPIEGCAERTSWVVLVHEVGMDPRELLPGDVQRGRQPEVGEDAAVPEEGDGGDPVAFERHDQDPVRARD